MSEQNYQIAFQTQEDNTWMYSIVCLAESGDFGIAMGVCNLYEEATTEAIDLLNKYKRGEIDASV